MASIEDPTPPPMLIAHTSIQEKLYADTEEDREGGLFMKDIHRNNSSRSSYYFAEHLHKKVHSTNNQHQQQQDKNNVKANILRTEISRLREEMMLKINALENEMAGHTQQRDIIRHTSSQHATTGAKLVDQTTQTTAAESAHHFDNNLSWERKLLDEIDNKLERLRREIFDKLESISVAPHDTRPASPVWNPRKKTTPFTTASQSPPPRQFQPTFTSAISSGHQHSTNSEPKNNAARSFDAPRDRDAYHHRLFEPYSSRKSPVPISHHYSSSPVIRDTPATSHEHSLNRGLYYEHYHTFSSIDQFTQTAREELSRHLVDQWFSYDDLADANVRGVKGKRLLDPSKIQKVRDTVFKTYPVRDNENEDYIWKVICDKINAKCRGVTRTLKRKSNSNDFMPYSHDSIITSSMVGAYHSSKYRKDSFEYDDRFSFASPVHQNVENSHQTRTSSSSDSDSTSTELPPPQTIPPPTSAVAPKSPEKPAARVSSVSCFSSRVKIENTETFSTSTKSLEGEQSEVRVLDEDDSRSDGTSSVENDQNSSSPKTAEVLHDPNSALDICDQLAERYMEHFPQAHDTTDKKLLQGNREEFTRALIEAMFTRSTLAHSNVTGARGKFMLDPVKIAKVRETVFRKFPAVNDDEEDVVWKILTTKINTKCRGVKRLMKRKGVPPDFMYGDRFLQNGSGSSGEHSSDKLSTGGETNTQ